MSASAASALASVGAEVSSAGKLPGGGVSADAAYEVGVESVASGQNGAR